VGRVDWPQTVVTYRFCIAITPLRISRPLPGTARSEPTAKKEIRCSQVFALLSPDDWQDNCLWLTSPDQY